jgi:beta-mannanase
MEANPASSRALAPTKFADLTTAADCLPTPTRTPGIYFGVFVPRWWDHNLAPLKTFENQAKKKVSIIMWYQGWGVTDETRYFQTALMEKIRTEHGSIPMVSWEPWYYAAPEPKYVQPDYQLIDIINGTYDTYIEQWADASKEWGHPYFLRFAAEMNGDWFSWSEGVNGNKTGEYVRAWKHVHDIFTKKGVTNVTWVWSPNVEYDSSTPLEGLYPGDDYVDWLGMDGYNWGTVPPDGTGTVWQTFAQVFGPTYAHITKLSKKPLMIAETASAIQGGSKAAWITDAYSTQILCNFKRIKAVIWFNEKKERDWPITLPPSAQNAFARAIQSCYYATNQYGALRRSPIPIPVSLSREMCSTGDAQDGWVLESTETSNRGGSMNDSAGVLRLGDDAARRQYRTVLSFKTDGLPDDAVITSATLKIKHHSVTPPGTNVIALASKSIGLFKPVLYGGWYTIRLPETVFPYINKLTTHGGLTQFRLRFKLDDNNNNVANVLNIFSGNRAVQAQRPELIIRYRVP